MARHSAVALAGGDHPGHEWSQGIPLKMVRALAEYWCTGYDWRAAEARLNRFPQFITEIDGQRIHFPHVRSERDDAIPLLITHGHGSRRNACRTGRVRGAERRGR
ncbi:epoxide hydrolase N-terminal domain-containing protein [Streptosporangium soli]